MPLVVAGDIFHRWNSPPELINLMIRHFPHCYAVAGNHDLPYHNYADIKRSAYWTLVQAGKITHLKPGVPVNLGGVDFVGYSFGQPPENIQHPRLRNRPIIAVIHDYCWAAGHTHPGAPEEKFYRAWQQRLHCYTGLIFGDNHQGFYRSPPPEGKPWVWNGGAFTRQSVAEADHQPAVGLVTADGTHLRHALDTTGDRLAEVSDDVATTEDFGEVVTELLNLEKTHVDFPAAVRRAVRDVPPAVRRLVLEYLGEDKW